MNLPTDLKTEPLWKRSFALQCPLPQGTSLPGLFLFPRDLAMLSLSQQHNNCRETLKKKCPSSTTIH